MKPLPRPRHPKFSPKSNSGVSKSITIGSGSGGGGVAGICMSGNIRALTDAPISTTKLGQPPVPNPLIGKPGFHGTVSGAGACVTTVGAGVGNVGGIGGSGGKVGIVATGVTLTVVVTGGATVVVTGAAVVVKDEVGGQPAGKLGSGGLVNTT
tara:strand:+ start:1895 stop:2353 length:459 start_codon:yes stop_codon:yes gene_type:complete